MPKQEDGFMYRHNDSRGECMQYLWCAKCTHRGYDYNFALSLYLFGLNISGGNSTIFASRFFFLVNRSRNSRVGRAEIVRSIF